MDIFQDTFIRYSAYKNKDEITNPRAFIFKIAANLATDYMRSRARYSKLIVEHYESVEDIEGAQPSPERNMLSEQQLEQLIAALAELTPKCRTVFILLKFRQYSYAQVERELGISQTMILKYLNRALSHCRERLGESL